MAEAAAHNGNGKKAVVGPTTTTTTTTRPIAEALAEAAAKYNSNGKKAVAGSTIESEYDFCNNNEKEEEKEKENEKEEGISCAKKLLGCSSAEEQGKGWVGRNQSLYRRINRFRASSQLPKEDEDVGPLDTFTITVDGICLDSHIHPSVKARYWALCSSRSAILHRTGLLRFLPIGVGLAVKYFVQLADNVREAKPDLPIYIFDRWIEISKTLESIECFDNGFLLERIEQLRSFLCGDQGMPLIKQVCLRGRLGEISQELQELKGEIKRLMLNQTQEMQDVEVQIEPLIRKMKELDTIKQDLATSLSDLLPMVDACRYAFAELAAAPW